MIACILDEQCIQQPEKLPEEIPSESESESTGRTLYKEMRRSRCDTGCNEDGESKTGSEYMYVYVFINNINVTWCIYTLSVM